MEGEKYAKELDVAVRVVHMACSLCQRLQQGIVSAGSDLVKSKEDDSPVTVADWSVQATVSWILSEFFGSQNVSIIAEEDVQTLSKADSASLVEAVVNTVNECLSGAPKYGLKSPPKALNTSQVLEAISRCNSVGGPKGRHWVLDPVDGTLGFVRGDQYAVALALVEDGKVVIGVLGCPNYPMKKELLSYHYQYHETMSRLSPPSDDMWERGCVMYAKRGSGEAWMQPPITGDKKFVWPNSARLVQKSALRVYSMVKYAAIARGDAELFMKFARTGYKEKIWDHAAGVVIVEEAGGVVTDAGGRPLDFSKGPYLEGLDRGIVVCSGATLHEKIIDAVYASWDSSNL
ncbi:PAP-specific phosphatase HAL2-like [Prunus yedoensis var. nudiflora]|uniref:PAP-specific phosphatase HAL2-like n=1 Tax=Prunus yedoensis var. nudiflora TaxID=2094558 RepID=A0A314YZE5_PRUYE|nr:PAP-specific phosphatase HAL2-like [Prunus yedoensis var. nudiflora]